MWCHCFVIVTWLWLAVQPGFSVSFFPNWSRHVSYPCLTRVLPVSYPCLTRVLPVSYPCLTRVLPVSYWYCWWFRRFRDIFRIECDQFRFLPHPGTGPAGRDTRYVSPHTDGDHQQRHLSRGGAHSASKHGAGGSIKQILHKIMNAF